jgi:hypothetical protein
MAMAAADHAANSAEFSGLPLALHSEVAGHCFAVVYSIPSRAFAGLKGPALAGEWPRMGLPNRRFAVVGSFNAKALTVVTAGALVAGISAWAGSAAVA